MTSIYRILIGCALGWATVGCTEVESSNGGVAPGPDATSPGGIPDSFSGENPFFPDIGVGGEEGNVGTEDAVGDSLEGEDGSLPDEDTSSSEGGDNDSEGTEGSDGSVEEDATEEGAGEEGGSNEDVEETGSEGGDEDMRSRIHPVPLKSASRALWSTGVLRAHRALKRSMGVSSWCALRMWWKGSLADLDSGNVKRA